MTPPRIIGLTGKKFAGKGEVAKILSSYTVLSFATPLRKMLLTMGVTQAEMAEKESIIPRFGASPRRLLQTLGTDWGRDMISPHLWVNIAREIAEWKLDHGQCVVFDDVRFDDEAEMIIALGGEIWRIHRGHGTVDSHASEHGVDDSYLAAVIYNSSTIEALREQVRILIGFEQRVVTL